MSHRSVSDAYVQDELARAMDMLPFLLSGQSPEEAAAAAAARGSAGASAVHGRGIAGGDSHSSAGAGKSGVPNAPSTPAAGKRFFPPSSTGAADGAGGTPTAGTASSLLGAGALYKGSAAAQTAPGLGATPTASGSNAQTLAAMHASESGGSVTALPLGHGPLARPRLMKRSSLASSILDAARDQLMSRGSIQPAAAGPPPAQSAVITQVLSALQEQGAAIAQIRTRLERAPPGDAAASTNGAVPDGAPSPARLALTLDSVLLELRSQREMLTTLAAKVGGVSSSGTGATTARVASP